MRGVGGCVWGDPKLQRASPLSECRGNQHPGSQVLGSLPPLRIVSAEEGAQVSDLLRLFFLSFSLLNISKEI